FCFAVLTDVNALLGSLTIATECKNRFTYSVGELRLRFSQEHLKNRLMRIPRSSRALPPAAAALLLCLLAACGGSPADAYSVPAASNKSDKRALLHEALQPLATGDTATDGLNWINFRRHQA